MQLVRSNERGYADHGWLNSHHTFSFAGYHNPDMMGFGPLRVINEDRVRPGQGFGTHGHRDMEILSYVLDGALEHKDSMGNGSIMRAGDVQRMTAGTDVMHSEFNHSSDADVHFLQIWILPEESGLTPGYEQQSVSTDDKRDALRLIASRDGRDGSLTIHQDADIYASIISAESSLSHRLGHGRRAWVQVVRGAIMLNGERLEAGDAAAFAHESRLEFGPGSDGEFLLFDMTS